MAVSMEITNAYTLGPNKSTGNVSHGCPMLRKIILNWWLLVLSVSCEGFVYQTHTRIISFHRYLHLDLTYFLLCVRVFYNAEGQMSACRKLLAMQMVLV